MRSTLLALVVVVLGITATLSAPLEKRQGNQRRGPETREEQIKYLRRFGHWRGPESDTDNGTDEDLRRSLMAFQSYSGLKATGKFDDETKKLMATLRCGDAEYKFGSKWPMTALTYRIVNYTPDLPTAVTKSIIIKAFKFWSDVSPLTFKESNTDEANIDISFIHRDLRGAYRIMFYAPEGVMAHALPPPGAFIHFFEDEQWTDNTSSGINLLWVAVHEIGHAIGLDHSTLRSSIMYPYYVQRNLNLTPDPDDIRGIQSIYGKP